MAYIGNTEVLVEKTIQMFGYDPDTLNSGSHKRVVVKCKNCEEEFLREIRVLNNLHKCPTFRSINNINVKWCNQCERYLEYDNFHKSVPRKNGLDTYCKECINNGDDSRRNNLDKWIRYIYSIKKHKSDKKGLPFDLDVAYLSDLWVKSQRGKCFYSRIDLVIGRNDLRSASLERIIPNKGYIKGNVAWSSKAMNYMKNSYSYHDFASFLSDMGVSHHTVIRCEAKLLNDSAALPSRSKEQDAGLDISSIEDITIVPNDTVNISTGVILSAPPGHYFTIEGRSGLFKKGLFPLRGIIDSSYIGEMNVSLHNSSNVAYDVKRGDRIAQLILHKVYVPDIVMVDNFSVDYCKRGTDGYGSTGR